MLAHFSILSLLLGRGASDGGIGAGGATLERGHLHWSAVVGAYVDEDEPKCQERERVCNRACKFHD
jgi:hypothetical protein